MGITAINGVAITASLSLSASNTVSAQSASTVTVTDTTTGVGPYYVMFADGTTGNRSARVDSNTLTFNATTNLLTATASNALTSSTALTATVGANTTAAIQQYILWTPSYAGGGGTQQVIISSSNVLTYIPSTGEFKAGFVNGLAAGVKNYTADANLTIDASLTQSVAWVASLTTTRSLIVNNLESGREVEVYIRNTNATQRQIIFSGSATTTGHVLINMATPFLNGASTTIQNIPATNGTIYPRIKNIAGTFVGGL